MSTDQYQDAQDRVGRRFLQGAKDEEALLTAVGQTVIVDRLVPPRQMAFSRTSRSCVSS